MPSQPWPRSWSIRNKPLLHLLPLQSVNAAMSGLSGLELSIPTNTNNLLISFSCKLFPTTFKVPLISHFPCKFKPRTRRKQSHSLSHAKNLLFNPCFEANGIANAQVEEKVEVEVAEGYTMTQFCDKIIDVFLTEKPRVKEWKKYLILREEWSKYRESFYDRCRIRADKEIDPSMKQKLISLESKVKKIDDEMERHHELLKEIQDSPTDINAIITRRREDFTDEFFRYLNLVSETYDGLEDRDEIARLAARCLSAVGAYDNTLEAVENLDAAQGKFSDILNSPSVDVACEKIKSLAKGKELDSSLILLINSAWASAKDSATMKNEVKEIMYRLYKATKSSLKSIAPREIKLLKHLLNIMDPEERFSALATAFSPGNEHEAKDPHALYTTPKELHKWIKIMLDAYTLSKEETDIKEAKKMTQPVVIQRLFILKETIEEEYFDQRTTATQQTEDKTGFEEL